MVSCTRFIPTFPACRTSKFKGMLSRSLAHLGCMGVLSGFRLSNHPVDSMVFCEKYEPLLLQRSVLGLGSDSRHVVNSAAAGEILVWRMLTGQPKEARFDPTPMSSGGFSFGWRSVIFVLFLFWEGGFWFGGGRPCCRPKSFFRTGVESLGVHPWDLSP